MKTVSVSQATHVGQRDNNEDRLLALPELGLFVVADGLGGHEGGEIASAMAVDAIEEFVRDRPASEPLGVTLRQALAHANDRILDAQARPEYHHVSLMAATVVAMACDPKGPGTAFVGWAGDSRCYRFRNGRLERITVDHVDARPYINRCLGAEEEEEGDLRKVDVRPGDVMLLVSDGLHDTLSDTEIAHILRGGGGAEQLVQAALAAGNTQQDNVSVVVVGF